MLQTKLHLSCCNRPHRPSGPVLPAFHKPKGQLFRRAVQEDRQESEQSSAAAGQRAVQQGSEQSSAVAGQQLVGEDAAAFDASNQSLKAWSLFFGLLTFVLGLLYVVRFRLDANEPWGFSGETYRRKLVLGLQVWIQPGTGLGDDFVAQVEAFSNGSPEVAMLLILGVFAVVHSGLAGLRPYGRQLIPLALAGSCNRVIVCTESRCASTGGCVL